MSLLAVSHVVLATGDVPRITRFFAEAFELDPYFENEMFSEFVLPSRFRIAFFVPVGASAKRFRAEADRDGGAFGVTVTDVEAAYERLVALQERYPLKLSGPPRTTRGGRRASS